MRHLEPALGRYPEDGAQRYSLVDMSESLLLILELAVSYQVTPKLRVGAGLQNMIFQLASTMVFSGCPGQTLCAPEDPEMDALGKVTQLDLFNPSGVLGVQYDVARRVRAGLALQLPFFVAGKGKFETVLPSSGFYDGATVVGDRADVSFTLPPILRAGVEAGLGARWKAELAASIEFWSMHDELAIEPRDVRILRGELERTVKDFREPTAGAQFCDRDCEDGAAGIPAASPPSVGRVAIVNGLAAHTVGRDFAI